MDKLFLVTYTRKDEILTNDLIAICDMLNNKFNSFKCIVFVEKDMEIDKNLSFKIDIVHMTGTKYLKLKKIIEEFDVEFILSVDNDIKADIKNLDEFLSISINNNYDIGWGKIFSQYENRFISKMVYVDKMLSHNVIRPLLWNLGIGISVPGQCFLVKRLTFANKLKNIDTFLDDLEIGLYTSINKNKMKLHQFKKAVGYEIPNSSFYGLWRQRSRWAQGYRVILESIKDNKEKKLIIIHAFAYHIIGILNWIICCFLLLSKRIEIFLLYISILSFIISKENLKSYFYCIMYQLFFPIFHIRWLYCVVFKKNIKEV